jgi:hypothetical protein
MKTIFSFIFVLLLNAWPALAQRKIAAGEANEPDGDFEYAGLMLPDWNHERLYISPLQLQRNGVKSYGIHSQKYHRGKLKPRKRKLCEHRFKPSGHETFSVYSHPREARIKEYKISLTPEDTAAYKFTSYGRRNGLSIWIYDADNGRPFHYELYDRDWLFNRPGPWVLERFEEVRTRGEHVHYYNVQNYGDRSGKLKAEDLEDLSSYCRERFDSTGFRTYFYSTYRMRGYYAIPHDSGCQYFYFRKTMDYFYLENAENIYNSYNKDSSQRFQKLPYVATQYLGKNHELLAEDIDRYHYVYDSLGRLYEKWVLPESHLLEKALHYRVFYDNRGLPSHLILYDHFNGKPLFRESYSYEFY